MTGLELDSCQVPKHSYKKTNKDHIAIPSILERQFAAVEPNIYWCGDLTYILTGSRCFY